MLPLSLILFAACLGAILYVFYKWATKNNDYFKIRGIPAKEPSLFFGNTAALFLKKNQLIDTITELYEAFPKDR